MLDANELESRWATDPRWAGVRRDYTGADVVRLRGSVQEEHTLARIGARKLWDLLTTDGYVNALGTLTGGQAVQSVKAGLRAIYVGGWQIAADANLSGQTYPDLSLYPANSVPQVVRRINNALLRHDQIAVSEGDTTVADWMLPILADAEAGFGGPLNAFELMKSFIAAGAGGVHWEDQLATQMKTGPQGGKVLVPTSQHLRMLNAARLATDVCDVPTVVMARTDAHSGAWLTSDVDERDRPFLTGERSPEGYHRVRPGVDAGIARALAYAPYSDLIWMETANPDLAEARKFAEAVRGEFPDQALAFNCYPGFDWTKGFDRDGLESYQRELGAMGFRFQFITAAGYHSLNHGMFDLAANYRDSGVAAYADLQQREYASETAGFTATKGARDVGMGYFDLVSTVLDPQV